MTIKSEPKTSWGTTSEIEFLKSIGRSETKRYQSVEEQIRVLRGYLRGSKDRNWGGMDKEKCMNFAHQRLKALEYIRNQDGAGTGQTAKLQTVTAPETAP
jgi:hypothetical protein